MRFRAAQHTCIWKENNHTGTPPPCGVRPKAVPLLPILLRLFSTTCGPSVFLIVWKSAEPALAFERVGQPTSTTTHYFDTLPQVNKTKKSKTTKQQNNNKTTKQHSSKTAK